MKLDKAELAEQAGLTMLSRACHSHRFLSDAEIKSISEAAWVYADAMQAEADKRVERGVPEVIGGECQHFLTTLNGGYCFDCNMKLGETA